MERLEIDQSNESLAFKNDNDNLANIYKDYIKCKDKLLLIDYFSVTDYLYLLIEICQLLNYRKDSLIFLAAAVSDFYLPAEETAEHKIQSNQSDCLNLVLKPVPKLIGFLRTAVCPDAFIVSFKLETDEKLLIKKAKESILTNGHDLVIGNVLSLRKEQVIFVGVSANPEVVNRNTEFIEEEIITKTIEIYQKKRRSF